MIFGWICIIDPQWPFELSCRYRLCPIKTHRWSKITDHEMWNFHQGFHFYKNPYCQAPAPTPALVGGWDGYIFRKSSQPPTHPATHPPTQPPRKVWKSYKNHILPKQMLLGYVSRSQKRFWTWPNPKNSPNGPKRSKNASNGAEWKQKLGL